MKKVITVMVLVLLILAVPVKSQEILQDQNIEMVLVEKGSFEMGDTEGEGWNSEKPLHKVTFTYDYYIGKYEVTFDQYEKYIGKQKYYDNEWGRGSRPVINVSWYNAIGYCNWLSEKEGLAKAYDENGKLLDSNGKITRDLRLVEGYRLPTEAEWEYAARGGSKSKGYKYSGSDKADDVAWYADNFSGTTHEVGTKQPNELGIYDMSGNVSEWCNDYYKSSYYENSPDENPCNFITSFLYGNVIRGSCCYSDIYDLRISKRSYDIPVLWSSNIGFRIVRTAPSKKLEICIKDEFETHLSTETILVEQGNFEMGDTAGVGAVDENPVHNVTFTYDFCIGKYEVTFDQYDRYCEDTKKATPDDNGWGRGNRPVINVSWYDAIGYCNWLSEKEGLAKAYDEKGNFLDKNGNITTDPDRTEGYRLPTEAEWEYAARGGNRSKGYMLSGSNKADAAAWCVYNSGGTTHEVGTKIPNELGIYDMSGNISEMCNDWYSESYYESSPDVNPCNLVSSLYGRVLRGGSCQSDILTIHSSYRSYIHHADKCIDAGFRIVRTGVMETISKEENRTKIKADTNVEGAKVYLNGEYIGTTPLIKETVPIHNAQIKITKKGFEDKVIKNVYIPKNETTQVYVEFIYELPETVLVKKGSFQMGNIFIEGDENEKPLHNVTFTYDFCIGKYEITFDQYDRYCEDTKKATPDDNGWGRGNRPVINVSWYDAIGYCNWLSEKEGLAKAYDSEGKFLDSNGNITTDPSLVEGYRLPTEAEWEYAARGGSKSKGYKFSGSNKDDDVAWYVYNSGGTTHEVGTKKPNELSIYDMSGNVSEWCSDSYYSYFSANQTNPYNFSDTYIIERGGGFKSSFMQVRTAARKSSSQIKGNPFVGFRIIKTENIKKSKRLENLTIIKVGTNIEGAKVYLNKSYIGKTPLVEEISPCYNVKMKITKEGYEDKIFENMNIFENRVNEVHAELVCIMPGTVLVEKGSFQMGNMMESAYDWELPVHTVTFTYDFYIGKYEVTFEQYDRYCYETQIGKPDDYRYGRGLKPVIDVSWYDAIGYCNWRSEKEGLAKAYDSDGNFLDSSGNITTDPSLVEGYRLPTEAEWEYAAKGGNKSKGFKYSGSDNIGDVAWYYGNAYSRICDVGTKLPNELGIYDMSGNVSEWCMDWYDGKYYENSPAVNPYNSNPGNDRTFRGGSVHNSLWYTHTAYRYYISPNNRSTNVGFRIVKTAN